MRTLNSCMARALLAVMVFSVSGAAGARSASEPESVTVYAAASMTDVIGAAAAEYESRTGIEVRQVNAASSVIARQIAAGAPADLFVSANTQWMDFLEKRDLLEPETRRDIAGNRLVVVVPAESLVAAEQGSQLGRDWLPARLALGETDAVPAGIYARQALIALGRWDAVERSAVMAGSVRVALAWVARGEVDAGIVYASDAASTARVRPVWTFPEESHRPIRYPAAVLRGRRGALGFLDFLAGEDGQRLVAEHGFLPVEAG